MKKKEKENRHIGSWILVFPIFNILRYYLDDVQQTGYSLLSTIFFFLPGILFFIYFILFSISSLCQIYFIPFYFPLPPPQIRLTFISILFVSLFIYFSLPTLETNIIFVFCHHYLFKYWQWWKLHYHVMWHNFRFPIMSLITYLCIKI